MIPPRNIAVVVNAHPDLRVAPDLLLWLLDYGVPRSSIVLTSGNERDCVCGYNRSVEMALTRRVEWALFADHDVRPCNKTAPMMAAPYDLTCAMCDTEKGLESWASPGAFHGGLWVAKLDTLRKIGSPWFAWRYNAAGSQVTGCLCEHLADKARACGYTVGHAGYAHHWPRGAKLPDAIQLLSDKGAR